MRKTTWNVAAMHSFRRLFQMSSLLRVNLPTTAGRHLSWNSRSGVIRRVVAPAGGSHSCYSTLHKRSLLMKQFDSIKSQYPNYILLYQVGDFYELYGEDASEVASRTSLRVTRRNNTFMAGFPVRSLHEWQRTLVEAGFQLAICNQIPKNDGRLMGREVVKLVTPGTLIEPMDQQSNYLMCVSTGPSKTLGLAWIDISTSEFQVARLSLEKLFEREDLGGHSLQVSSSDVEDLDEDLERVCPSEVLLPESIADIVRGVKGQHRHHHPAIESLVKSSLLRECHVTVVEDSWFSSESGELMHILNGKSFSDVEKNIVPYLATPTHFSHHQHMSIDANTRRALEIISPLHSNPKKATLLGCIDRTTTAAGGRLIKTRLASPLTDVEAIRSRLAAVDLFSNQQLHAETITTFLRSCADVERIIQKIATGSANIPDLQAIKNTLTAAGQILKYVQDTIPEREILVEDLRGLQQFSELVDELEQAIGGVKYGNYIMKGYSSEVDSLREQIRANEREVDNLINRLRNHFGITRLTVAPHKSYVRVLEVPKSQASLAEKCEGLIRIEQIQAKIRFSHIQLQILNAELQRLEISYTKTQENLFQGLCEKVMAEAEGICLTAKSLARLDVSTSLGILAAERGYCKPEVVGSGSDFHVRGGWHPVVSSLQTEAFVSNDCDMSENRLWIITGPNMGGKSTFLRQNALIAILAQMGSFVPAKDATIGVVDRLFARVGASDNVVRHMSTFHMEMNETANILSNATPHSFVILDEIGRGTSTTEGLSIAQAVIEYLHDNTGCRTLLATHFHQLAKLGGQLTNTGCYKLVAERDSSGISFTYKIQPGYVNHSFAIDVAQLAGMPHAVTKRAEVLLSVLESEEHSYAKNLIASNCDS